MVDRHPAGRLQTKRESKVRESMLTKEKRKHYAFLSNLENRADLKSMTVLGKRLLVGREFWEGKAQHLTKGVLEYKKKSFSLGGWES